MGSLVAPDEEPLTTGWEPDLDPADSVVRSAVLVHASWAVAQARSLGRAWHDDPRWAAGHVGDRGAMTNWVILKQPAPDVDRVLTAADEFFPAGVPFLVVSAWPTGDLRHRGLGLVGHPPLMFRPWSSEPMAAAADLDVRWVADPSELADAERVVVEGYPVPELQPFEPGRLYTRTVLDTDTRIAVAYEGDTAVATAAAHSAAGVTLIEYVAVRATARGRQAGKAVTAAATTAFPGQGAVLLASDDGQPLYTRLGYHRIERWTVWARA